jgi:hypothetical protein
MARTKSRLPRRAPELLPGVSPQGRGRKPRVVRGPRKALLATPGESEEAQDSSGNRAAFSLDTFFWRSKRKYLAFGGETPIQITVALATL